MLGKLNVLLYMVPIWGVWNEVRRAMMYLKSKNCTLKIEWAVDFRTRLSGQCREDMHTARSN